nr:CPBP family intramembrane glutamic endopeptidase [Rufibacter sediminis]
MFDYLEDIPASKKWVMLLVLLSMASIPVLANWVFIIVGWRDLFKNQLYLLAWGVVVYLFWIIFLVWLKRNDDLHWRHLSLGSAEIKKGLVLGFCAYAVVQVGVMLKLVFSGHSLTLTNSFSSIGNFSKAIGIFAFNIFIGAFIEEVLNRAYLIPQVYLLLKRKVERKSFALLIALLITQILFALSHLPRDLFRYEVTSMDALFSTQVNLFWSGLIYAVLYLKTRNIIFVSFFHALASFNLTIVTSDAPLLLYNGIVFFIIAILWRKPKEKTEPAWA